MCYVCIWVKIYNIIINVNRCDQKKRPHNLIIGRIYEGSILDMIEFGIENYESLK